MTSADPTLLGPAQLAASQHLFHLAHPRLASYGAACLDALTLLSFSDLSPSVSRPASLLSSKHLMTSLVACYDAYLSPSQARAGWDELGAYVGKYSALTLPPIEAFRLPNTNPNDSFPQVDVVSSKAVYDGAVLVSRRSWEAGCRTEAEWDRQMAFHHAYGFSIYLLLATMLLIGILNRLWTAYISARPLPRLDLSEPRTTSVGRLRAWYRRRVGTRAAFGYRHLQPWGMLSIPTRIQAIFILIFVALNVVWSCLGYRTFEDNLFYVGQRDRQLARYVADRTGIMSFYNLPLLWLLAGRNDFLIWITGWSYQSCNLFHRWVARTATLQALAHSFAYTWLQRDRLAYQFTQRPWATGIFATVAMALIIPLSIRPIRHRFYELFLAVHIVLSVGVLVLLFFHVKNFGSGYYGYLWACVGVWAFDRLARIARILLLSPTPFFRGRRNTLAITCPPTSSGLIRLAVRTPFRLTPKPGAYFFLYFSRSPLENHPFTLASWRPTSGGGTELHFLCKTREGGTSVLRRRVEAAQSFAYHSGLGEQFTDEGTVLKMSVLLEGPYGLSHPVGAYERVLLVAGGSGITAVLPYVFQLARDGKGERRRVKLVWMVKDVGQVQDVLRNELRPGVLDDARVDVWVTGKSVEPLSTPSPQTPATPVTPPSMRKSSPPPPPPPSQTRPRHVHPSIPVSSTRPARQSYRVPPPRLMEAAPVLRFEPDTPLDWGTGPGPGRLEMMAAEASLSRSFPLTPEWGASTASDGMRHKTRYTHSRESSASSIASAKMAAMTASLAQGASHTSPHSPQTSDPLSSPDSSHSPDEKQHIHKVKEVGRSLARIRVRAGRPNVSALLKTELAQLVGRERLAVLACGPERMMDDLRLAVGESYGEGEGQVGAERLEYFEEVFSW